MHAVSQPPMEPSKGGTEQRSVTASNLGLVAPVWKSQPWKGILEEGSEVLLASLRQKSTKSYDSLFHKWVVWCREWDSDPVFGPISEVVNFLAHLFKEGYQYCSLNSYYLPITLVIERMDRFEVD